MFAHHIDMQSLENRIEAALQDWQVVGGAASIIKGGEVLSCRGYGLREIGKTAQVDEHTLFGIGSNTKSFTAAGVGLLVDEGKLDWDDRVIKFLPDFQLSDPWVTERLTLRDLLSHRTGLGRSMRILYNRDFDLPKVIHRMRYMPFEKGFRDQFSYNNYHFMLAGRVIEVVAGQSWPEFMQTRFFEPLHMGSTSADLQQLLQMQNRSAAHDNLEDSLFSHQSRLLYPQQAVPWVDVGNQPAGGIYSTAHDLTQWMRMLLAHGEYEGKAFLSSRVIAEMTQSCSTMKNPVETDLGFLAALGAPVNFYTYGLGWFVVDYKGLKFYFHGGQITGFNSIVVFVPQLYLAYCVLLNLHHTLLHAPLFLTIADAFIGGDQRDWSAEFLDMAQYLKQQEADRVEDLNAERKSDLLPSLSLESYAGTYEHDFVGPTCVALENGRLVMHYGSAYHGDLVHWQGDEFYAHWEDKTNDWSLVKFHISSNQQVVALSVEDEGRFDRVH